MLSYALSFIYLGIYWNNHHHMLHATQHIDGSVMWANLHLLFWLSLIPFVTGWAGENHFAALPVAMYGVVLLMAALAYTILQWRIIAHEGASSLLGTGCGPRPQGQGLGAAVRGGHPLGAAVTLDRSGAVHSGRADLAGARPPHRKGLTPGLDQIRLTCILS